MWSKLRSRQTDLYKQLLVATQEYKAEMDLLAAFCEACIVIDYVNGERIAATDIEREQDRRAQLKAFYAAYATIFENSLRFNIDMGFYNEKPGGLAEKAALDFVSTIKYNRFSVREFEAIVNYLNAHFWAYYRPGNPNNYQKNYTLFFGRESSVVLYIEAKFENDVEIKKTIADLKRIARPDEIGIESEMPTWDGKRRARLRLWWD